MRYHPDRNQDKELGEVRMKEINFIYSILSNPDKRKWYNSTISEDDISQGEQYSHVHSDIYYHEVDVVDSSGRKSKLKVGDKIYYLVDIDKTVITWKYRSKEYFDVIIKNIYDPDKKNVLVKVLKCDRNKTPLCTAYWGKSEILIYKEDFEAYWISQESYKAIDAGKGFKTGIFILMCLCLGGVYFYSEFSPSSEKASYLRSKASERFLELNDSKLFYSKEYFATDAEISYILTGFYTACTKESTKTNRVVEVSNIPDQLGIVKGEIQQGQNVLVLLYCSTARAYKIKSADLLGWVPRSSLVDPKCEGDSTKDE